jgi:thioredoxin-like negative regulator of GroEL
VSIPASFTALGNKTPEDFLDSTSRPVVFYFHDPDLNLCQLINPTVAKICQEEAPGAQYVAITAQDHKDFTYEFNVTRAPSFLIYYNDEEVRRLTNIDYNDQFDGLFRDFLVGDFLFSTTNFHELDENNFFNSLREWFQLNLVSFMVPGDPINWQLEPILSKLGEKHKNILRLHLINAETNPSILTQYNLNNLPSLILLDETEVLRKWHPASNPDQILWECMKFLEEEMGK